MFLVHIFSESQTHVKITDGSVLDHSHLVLVQVRIVRLKMLVKKHTGFTANNNPDGSYLPRHSETDDLC